MKAVITDFDGTLVDTFMPNYLAYEAAFTENDKTLTIDQYKECWGMRFNEFMTKMKIDNTTAIKIKEAKAKHYNKFVNHILLNHELIQLLKDAKAKDNKIAIASTASKVNLMNVLNYFNLTNLFDVIITGEDVKEAKPNPEVYQLALNKLQVDAKDAIVYEDSFIGIVAAKTAGINVIKVDKFNKLI